MEAVITLIKNPKADIYLIPDSPTGAEVVDEGKFKEICETGIGTFTLRSEIEVDEMNNTLTIKSVPLQCTIDSIMAKIAELKKKNEFREIVSMKDYTNNEKGVCTILTLIKEANPYEVRDALYKKNIGLKKSYAIGIKVIDDYRDYDYGIKDLLLAWIEARREIVRSSYNSQYVKAMEDQNINDVLILISNKENGAKTIEIATKSKNKQEYAEKLMKAYKIDSQKANTIVNMRTYQFNADAHAEYVQRKKELKDRIKELESIIDDDKKIDEIIIEQQKEGIKLFGRPRRSKIVKEEEYEVEVPDTDHIIGISSDGYIKKIPLEKQVIGQVGNSTITKYTTIKANNRDSLLIFDSTGVVSRIPINDIPNMKVKDIGIVLERYFNVHGDVVSILIEPREEDLKSMKGELYVVFLTKEGYVKKVSISEFQKFNGQKVAIKLPSTDALVAAEFASEKTTKDMIIYTNRGNGIRRNINDFKTMKANARGTREITIPEGEKCIGFDKIEPDKKYIFYLTTSGKVKITETKYLPQVSDKNEVLSLINLDKTDTLIGIRSVHRNDKVAIYKKVSEPVIIDLKEVQVSTRVAKAEKMIRTSKGDSIVNYTTLNVK